MTAAACAAPGCAKPVPPRRPGAIGRPPLYCSVACRPSAKQHAQFVVDLEEAEDAADPGRAWTVRLRRGRRSVAVAPDLGWLSANALAADLRRFLHPQEEGGDTID